MAHSLASFLGGMAADDTQAIHDFLEAFSDAGIAISLLMESPKVNPDQKIATHSGTTSLRALALEHAELEEELTNILRHDGTSVVSDKACSNWTQNVMDFAIKFRGAVEVHGSHHEAPEMLAAWDTKLFDGSDNLRHIAAAYEAGKEAGLRKAKLAKPRELPRPRGRD